MLAARAEEKERQQEEDLRRAQEAETEKEKQAAIEAALEQARIEREKAEEEEYNKWKGFMTVTETGTQDDEASIEAFVDYIEKAKVVALSDLASQFGLAQQATIQRVQELEASGRLSGVIDDRGKFVSVTKQEMEQITRFIRQRGRVSLAELVDASSKLIVMQETV